MIARTLVEEPPVSLNDGGAVREGVDAELDELRGLSQSGRSMIAAIEERERERTGIGSLKVRFNSVFGYYLEVTKANSKVRARRLRAQADPRQRRALHDAGAERARSTKILTAQERLREIERRIFAELRRQLLANAARVRETARQLRKSICSHASHTSPRCGRGCGRRSTRAACWSLIAGRHPVVERRLEESGGGPICTELRLPMRRRQSVRRPVAAADHRAEHGRQEHLSAAGGAAVDPGAVRLFVPAERMRLGLVDRIYTRIGASDNVARGRSTFMVEMTETAAILNTATSRSLVLLDEMGRGTATYDGLSLAWATVEHLHDASALARSSRRITTSSHCSAERLAQMQNVRVTVRESAGGIVFLHTVEAGAANKSYGIEVARWRACPSGRSIAPARC